MQFCLQNTRSYVFKITNASIRLPGILHRRTNARVRHVRSTPWCSATADTLSATPSARPTACGRDDAAACRCSTARIAPSVEKVRPDSVRTCWLLCRSWWRWWCTSRSRRRRKSGRPSCSCTVSLVVDGSNGLERTERCG